jgi:NNP family nitrate/nitrite transporter-like MFS transporter
VKGYFKMLGDGDAWWFILFYGVTFGGFVGLSGSLPSWYTAELAFTPVQAGYATAACVFAGSLVRPLGGALADRIGGIKTLSGVYARPPFCWWSYRRLRSALRSCSRCSS